MVELLPKFAVSFDGVAGMKSMASISHSRVLACSHQLAV